MQNTHVKICGLTRPDQARAVVKLGADAIGLVFAESPRQVTVKQAAEITAAVPKNLPTVGVFVDADAETINETVRQAGISHVQLHGQEPPTILDQIDAPCVKVFRVRAEDFVEQICAWIMGLTEDHNLVAIMLDAFNPNAAGGTGDSFNWDWVAAARADGRMDHLPPVVLAGGLDASNVAEAIRKVQPWAVDVSSGVESAPGIKDIEKVKAFLQAVKGVGG